MNRRFLIQGELNKYSGETITWIVGLITSRQLRKAILTLPAGMDTIRFILRGFQKASCRISGMQISFWNLGSTLPFLELAKDRFKLITIQKIWKFSKKLTFWRVFFDERIFNPKKSVLRSTMNVVATGVPHRQSLILPSTKNAAAPVADTKKCSRPVVRWNGSHENKRNHSSFYITLYINKRSAAKKRID